MVIDRMICGEGTAESEWATCAGLSGVPWVGVDDLIPLGARIVVVAPHPDDEVLPCGGLLAMLGGRSVKIVAVTDGEASHPDRADELRVQRPMETLVALSRLELEVGVSWLRLPDGGLLEREGELAAKIGEIFRHGDVVLTPWEYDGHPDHEATTRAVRRSAAELGLPVIEMPIWGWHWAGADDEAMPWERAVRVRIDAEARERKRSAIAAFTSQITDGDDGKTILSATTLDRFLRGWEVFFR